MENQREFASAPGVLTMSERIQLRVLQRFLGTIHSPQRQRRRNPDLRCAAARIVERVLLLSRKKSCRRRRNHVETGSDGRGSGCCVKIFSQPVHQGKEEW